MNKLHIFCPHCGREVSIDLTKEKTFCNCCGHAIIPAEVKAVEAAADTEKPTEKEEELVDRLNLISQNPKPRGGSGFFGLFAADSQKKLAKLRRKKKLLAPNKYNEAFFELFSEDLENDNLPVVPKATKKEIAACLKRREEEFDRVKSGKDKLADPDFTLEAVAKNQEIPPEIEVWVDKVYDYYFSDLAPMLGLVHGSEGARKQLFAYRGYRWYSVVDMYPGVTFD